MANTLWRSGEETVDADLVEGRSWCRWRRSYDGMTLSEAPRSIWLTRRLTAGQGRYFRLFRGISPVRISYRVTSRVH